MKPSNAVAIENKLPRVDVRQKVTGAARYAADQSRPRMLFVKFIRFPFGKGGAEGGNVERARAIPGVLEVEWNASEEARMPGWRMGHVVAESRAALDDALEALDPDFTRQRAATDADIMRLYRGPAPAGEALAAVRQKFSAAKIVVEAMYRTQVQTHSCLEPHGSMVDHRGDEVEVWASTQDVTGYHSEVSKHVGVPASKVLVHSEYVGGGFGSKFGPQAEGVLAARIAAKYKRPCRLVLDRAEEHLDGGSRPGSVQYMAIAANAEGRILGGRVHCSSVIGFDRGGGGCRNPINELYRFGDVERTEDQIQLNFAIPRAFRAPGWPQGVYAIESMMDELAKALDIDPLEIRRRNDPSPRRVRQLDLGARLIGWENRRPDGTWPGRVKRGYGCGGALWPMWNTACQAECRISRDGTVEVRSGVQDIGTGTFTVVTDTACKALGLDRSVVTGRVGLSSFPPGPGSGGSVVSRSVVPAVRDACSKALAEMRKLVADEWKVKTDDVEYAEGQFRSKSSDRRAAWKDVCAILKTPVMVAQGKTDQGMDGTSDGSSDCVQFACVDVDTETGILRVVKVVAVHSAGEYVNRLTAENQIAGGVVQGISYALFEDRLLDRATGAMVNADFLNYKIVGSVDVPEIEIVLDQDASDTGVRPLGEPATIPTAGAVANAVANALGVRVRSLPITPAKVLAALESKGGVA